MKFCTYTRDGRRFVGRVDEEDGIVTPFVLDPHDLAGGVEALIGRASLPDLDHGDSVALSEVRIEAPILRPRRNIFCVGKNYREHAQEFAASGFDSSAAQGVVPQHPIVFSKLPETVIATGDAIRIRPEVSTAIDYEAELAVIIGREGRGISREDALDHVWGYTIINDVTARDLQKTHSQWLIGKSQDTFAPMGPYVVTRDAFDLSAAGIRCLVNGELRQSSHTGLLIFDVPTLISVISAGITLFPGDIIATGTPAGVGIGFDPPRYLRDGDMVRIEIDGLGALENPVVSSSEA